MSRVVTDIRSALVRREFPSITMWNRLEGRPRADKFDRALKAEVRDALWMLTRQWQLGEFRGDDAGSPVEAKAHLTTTELRKYRPENHGVELFDADTPLEAKVERRPVSFVRDGRDMSLDLRLLMGRQWLKMLRAKIGADLRADFLAKYPVHAPDPTQQSDAIYCAHPEAWSVFAATAGRAVDGAKLYLDLIDNPPRPAWNDIAGIVGREADVDDVATRFVAWFEKLIYQPPENDAWVPDRLEYQFALSAPEGAAKEKVYTADEYYQGHLDWYSVDLDPKLGALDASLPPGGQTPPTTLVMVPTPVSFSGMPNTRWWTFEEGRTNFGDVKPDTTDLAKLLLIEFGLTFANDWFIIPYTVEAGSLVRIKGMAVRNVFGERTWVEAAGRGLDDNWQRWAMFLVNKKGQERELADTTLLLMPTAPKVQESRPLEEVMLARDEMANMVWGIERTVTLPTGETKPGREAAYELRHFFENLQGGTSTELPFADGANIRYKVMSTVPENWIPFIPVHRDGSNREIQLQRAALPRIIEGDAQQPRKVRPRTSLLRQGLDQDVPVAYFLHEEEVLRAGTVVTQSFQRTRWRDGRVWLWLGVRKNTGRGETSSGLAFDRMIDVQSQQ
jgi:hypothetical protein